VKPLGEPKYKQNTLAKVKQAKVRGPKSKTCKKEIGQLAILSFQNTSLDSNRHILLNNYPKWFQKEPLEILEKFLSYDYIWSTIEAFYRNLWSSKVNLGNLNPGKTALHLILGVSPFHLS